MQEEVEQKTVTLIIQTSKLTGRELETALKKFISYLKERGRGQSDVIPHGKQTVKELIGQNQGVSNIEITEKNIKGFERVARKYGVDYAVKKDSSGEIPKYLVFFKARDADALIAAFTEYSNKNEKSREKPSVIKLLRSFKLPEITKNKEKVRNKDKGLEL